MAEEFGEMIEGVRLIELAGVDQAHEHVADAGPVLRAIEKRILAMADRFFQSPLADVIVQRGSGFVQKERQLLPVFEQIIGVLPVSVHDCFFKFCYRERFLLSGGRRWRIRINVHCPRIWPGFGSDWRRGGRQNSPGRGFPHHCGKWRSGWLANMV